MDDRLKYAIDHGIIDLSYVLDEVEMTKRNEYLQRHKYSISEGSDGKWRTYLPDEIQGRRMVKRSTRKSLEDAVIDYYKSQEEKSHPMTFDNVYWLWRNVQDALVSANSVTKYDTNYKRFFQDTEFAQRAIEQISEDDIILFIRSTVDRLHLCKEACKALFSYIRNTIIYARKHKIIVENPMEFLQAKQFYKYCVVIVKPIEKRVVSDAEMDKLYQQFFLDYLHQPDYIPTYAVHLATLTGMRVGELSALKWNCVTDTYIMIDKSEKFNRKTKEYFISQTKNEKVRVFPMTDEISALLAKVKEEEIKSGVYCEWVFADHKGRIHAPIISSCSKNKCRQVGIDDRGIHAYRRTVNSKLRCSGVSATVAASLLGHTEEVNEQYYTFDITTLKERAEMVSKVSRKAD